MHRTVIALLACVLAVNCSRALWAADAPTAAPIRTMDVKLPKSAWESKHANAMKVGDWVEVDVVKVQGAKMRQECLEVGDHYTVTLTRSVVNGRTFEQKIKSVYSEPDPNETEEAKLRKEQNIEIKDLDDKIKVKDKEIAAKRHEVYKDGRLTLRTWVSAEIPMDGTVKTEDGEGKVVSQLTDYGFGK